MTHYDVNEKIFDSVINKINNDTTFTIKIGNNARNIIQSLLIVKIYDQIKVEVYDKLKNIFANT